LARKRATVQQLATEATVDLDEALITLWDAGIDYVNGPGDLLKRGDVNRARRILGLATRRELADPQYWQRVLGIGQAEFDDLLVNLGVRKLPQGGRLPKRAIHRLKGEVRLRGTSPYAGIDEETIEVEQPKPPLFTWETVGHERELAWLTVDQVRGIHYALVEDFLEDSDPIDPPGVRNENLLASAVFRPQTSVDGVLKYPTVEMSAAALLHGLVHDHPFHNGNKRTALVAMIVFLDENGFLLTCDQDILFKLVLQLAQHALVSGPRPELADRETLAVATWLHAHSRWVEKGDRTLPWRRLRRILSQYGCEFEFPSGAGNRINISRTVERPGGLFRRPRSHVLRVQTYYGDEGREIEKNTVNKIRHDLELDDLHGIDSGAFYENDPASLSEFIIKYRKTLRRLARL
jgi:death-on-curing family protein